MTSDERVLYSGHSPYNRVVITEDQDGLRTLRFGEEGAFQSVVKLDDPEYLDLEYVRVMPLCLGFMPKPRRLLVVGLGGGTVPRFLHHYFPEMTIDVVEIDPLVVEVARAYCGFPNDPRMQVYLEDGRDFVERAEGQYDMVILDTFDAEAIPKHLRTLEFLHAVRRLLPSFGVVVANVWGRKVNPLYDDMLATYREAFEDLYLFDVPGPGTKIFAALPREQEMTRGQLIERVRTIFAERNFRYDYSNVLRGFHHVDQERTRGGQILRD